MRLLLAMSLRAKLSLLTCIVAFTAVTMACIGFAGLGYRQLCVAEVQQFGQFVLGAGVISLVAFGVCCLVAIPFKRAISRPIFQLARTLDEVAASHSRTIDEVGQFSPECLRVLNAVDRLVARTTESRQVAQDATTKLGDRVADRKHGLVQELKRLRQRQHDLERARDTAEAASLAKCRLIADKSLEMRVPLDGILAEVQALSGDERLLTSQKAATRLEAIQRHRQQLEELVQHLAEIAKAEAGLVATGQVECFPQTVIAGVVDEYQSLADARAIPLEFRWLGSGKESICCDSDRLRQVVQSLVDNAIRFTEIGGVRITSRFEQTRGVRHLRIEVTDTGIGIDAEDLNQIFEPSDPPTRSRGDNGAAVIGLHLCRKIVAAMGGDITASSSVGEGSVFAVMLPAEATPALTAKASSGECGDSLGEVTQARTTSRESEVASSDQAASDQSRTRPPRILVVDDSDTNRDLTQLMLRRAGARVEGVENGLEAVQAAIRGAYDLILMDMQMPVMDGYSATREIRAQGIDVPIIALTAPSREFDEKRCRDAGCIGHLTKPVDADALLRAAERLLPKEMTLTRAVRPAAKPAIPSASAARPRSPYDFDAEPRRIEASRS